MIYRPHQQTPPANRIELLVPGSAPVQGKRTVRGKDYETRNHQCIESQFRHGSRLDLRYLDALSTHQFDLIDDTGLKLRVRGTIAPGFGPATITAGSKSRNRKGETAPPAPAAGLFYMASRRRRRSRASAGCRLTNQLGLSGSMARRSQAMATVTASRPQTSGSKTTRSSASSGNSAA